MKKISTIILSALFLSACSSGGTNNDEVAENEFVVTCSNGWLKYSATGTPMTFCYDQTWGDVVVVDQVADVGKLVEISFSKAPQGAPVISYESNDYPGGDDYHLSFNAIRITGSDEMIKAQFIEELNFPFKAEEFSLRKSDIGGVRAIRVSVKSGDSDYVKYYVPAAFDGYNLTFTANQEYAGDLDDMVYHVQF